MATALHALDLSLNVGARRDHDPLVDHERKGNLRVHGVAVFSRLRRDRLLQR